MRFFILLFVVAVLSLAGCTANVQVPDAGIKYSEWNNKRSDVPEKKYILQVGDEIEIKFYYDSELNEFLEIRPDGNISMQLISEVAAAGLTPPELESVLKSKYAEILLQPELTVIVRGFSSQKIYVGGEVGTPGIVIIDGSLTALQAIIQAGGFADSSAIKSVIVMRDQGTGKPIFKTINLKEDLAGHKQYNDIPLKPYDVVFVPKSTIAKLNQFVTQYIKELIPISYNLGFSWVYDLNDNDYK